MMGSSENPKRQANKALVPAIASSSDQLVPGTRIFACIVNLVQIRRTFIAGPTKTSPPPGDQTDIKSLSCGRGGGVAIFTNQNWCRNFDIILRRHFKSVRQFAGRILDDVAHPLHSSRSMRRGFRLISCRTSAVQDSVLSFLERYHTCEEMEIQKLRHELSHDSRSFMYKTF
ncbi:hypothetical protein SprV_0100110900 [Sparganum proliferum]